MPLLRDILDSNLKDLQEIFSRLCKRLVGVNMTSCKRIGPVEIVCLVVVILHRFAGVKEIIDENIGRPHIVINSGHEYGNLSLVETSELVRSCE